MRASATFRAGYSNACAHILLNLVGLEWAVSQTMRWTVATKLDEEGVPGGRIADQLGHANIRMTIDAYLGRDFDEDKSDLADLL